MGLFTAIFVEACQTKTIHVIHSLDFLGPHTFGNFVGARAGNQSLMFLRLVFLATFSLFVFPALSKSLNSPPNWHIGRNLWRFTNILLVGLVGWKEFTFAGYLPFPSQLNSEFTENANQQQSTDTELREQILIY